MGPAFKNYVDKTLPDLDHFWIYDSEELSLIGFVDYNVHFNQLLKSPTPRFNKQTCRGPCNLSEYPETLYQPTDMYREWSSFGI